MAHCAGMAQHKGYSHKGPVVEKRRQKGLECNNGIRNQGLKQQLCLGSKEIFYEALGQTTGLQIANRMARSSIRTLKTSVKRLWRSWPPPKWKKRQLAI
jgi:hypothetical protein